MQPATFTLTRAPIALAPAVRLVQPALVQHNQQPLLPWPAPDQAELRRCEIPARVQRFVGQLTTAVDIQDAARCTTWNPTPAPRCTT